MIKSLRRKFIVIAMSSVIAVLLLLIGGINIVNYRNVVHTADERLLVLSENGGRFPMFSEMDDDFPKGTRTLSAEAPFDTRYFTVTIDADGTVRSTDTGRIAAVSYETAADYTRELFHSGKASGFIGSYKFTTLSSEDETMYIFLDCSRELSSFHSFLRASILFSLSGILLVLIPVVLFSRIVFLPIGESYEKQKRFITDASHDIKTPLTIIDANIEVIEMIHGEDEWTKSIRNQVARLSALTEKLVFLSRMDEEQNTLTMLDFSLSDAVYDTAQPYEALAIAKDKALTLDITEGITYHGDETAIRQLISLLLDNAMKYTNEHGTISLSLKKTGKNIVLTAYNTVTDIEIGSHDVLFERFYRRDGSRNSGTGGSGIGLSVAQAIVHAHHGKIHAKSEDGHSICFTISF
ncbi:MAG: HAMP domain-containing histidine kinase [Lachnospiraceae bacterium]|nr:HAMP domain-containing histidine kinase [Lachnospiraceae bacterium]